MRSSAFFAEASEFDRRPDSSQSARVHSFFATTSRGLEPLLADELRALASVIDVEERRGGVAFRGPLEAGYRACLWSRTASRVLLPLARFTVRDERQLYDGVRSVRWADHLAPGRTFAVDFVGSSNLLGQPGAAITNSHYGALRTKDAIVDQLRDERGERPSIDRARPDVRINVHLGGPSDGQPDEQIDENDAAAPTATVAIDLAGQALHRRGWRADQGAAPLKENLAAALLLLLGWPELARAGAPLCDPMCGSGTLPIEAALMAIDRAPGLAREEQGVGFGFLGWAGHEAALWRRLVTEAHERELRDERALKRLPAIVGWDHDAGAVRMALGNVVRAGLVGRVHVERRELSELALPASSREEEPRGLLVTNPPYGERLGDEEALVPLYELLGDLLRRRCLGWTGGVLTSSAKLAKAIGLRPARRHALWNGPIECRLLALPISSRAVHAGAQADGDQGSHEGPRWRREREERERTASPESAAFRNRVEKNLRHLRKWARREEVHCFRVYDADLPEYAVAVDLYEDAAQVQEYAPPASIDPDKARARLRDVMLVLPEVLGLPPERLRLKVRRRQQDGSQYEKLDAARSLREVREGGLRFLVNLDDYLDTGLFLDGRELRRLVGELSPGRDVLNLFCYTGTATVYAARGGARSTTSVDLSNTYLDWAERNLALNGLRGPQHRLVRADCLDWLASERRRYDLIYLAPPTYSRSKRMAGDFDVQRDHVDLLRRAASLLTDDGVLLFETNLRRFRLDEAALPELRAEELTARPLDFRRNPRIHSAWRITRR